MQDLTLAGTDLHSMCPGWTDGTKYQFIQFIANTTTVAIQEYTNYSTFNSTVYSLALGYFSDNMWFGLYDDGTNVHWQISRDSVNFYTIHAAEKSGGYLSNYNSAFWGAQGSNGLYMTTLRCWDINGLNPIFPTSS